ncbi:MAG: hypothetical protein KAR08_01800, partial [Candidatus Heimdallarchaeota archaeon]|nr:hypothetical protein [Candidatus Heimdallarchaeota archaeon]
EISKEPLFSKQIISSLSDIDLFETFRFDLKSYCLTTNHDLFETPTLNMIRQKEKISRAKFESEMENIKKKLEYLLTNKIFDPVKVMNYLLYDQSKLLSKKEKISNKSLT